MYQKTSLSEKSLNRTDEQQKSSNGISLPAVAPVQKAAEEEPLQGKFETVQKAEEEEPLQGKFAPVQKAEEEEPLQGKFETVQKAEEEEPLQGKFETVQKAEEEEPLQGKFATVQKVGAEEEPVQGKFKTVQRAEAEGGEAEEEQPLQGKFATVQKVGAEEEPVQGKFETVQKVEEEEPMQGKFKTVQKKSTQSQPFQLQEDGGAAAKNNTGMPDNLKSGVESLSGYKMDDVKVHYNSDKPSQLQAHAYAQGTDIHIAPGQEQHLPHEAWHVAQQKQGRVQPTMQMKESVPVNDDPGLESEADTMGAKAMQMKAVADPAQLKESDLSGSSAQRKQVSQFKYPKALLTGAATQRKPQPVTAQFNRSRSSVITEESPDDKFQRENSGIVGMVTNAASVIGSINWAELAATEKSDASQTTETVTAAGGAGGAVTGLAGTATNFLRNESGPNVSGAAGDVVSGIGGSITSLIKAITSINQIYKESKGREDYLVGGGKIAIAMMAAMKSGCEAASSITKFVNGSVPPVMKSLIPGLGLAISACEIIVNAYSLYNSYSAEAEMTTVSDEFRSKLGEILGGEPTLTAPTLFGSEKRGKMFNRITYVRLKPGIFESLEAIMNAKPDEKAKKATDFKAEHKLSTNPVPIDQLCAAIRYYELGSKMQEVNQKRKVQGARNIFTNILALAGEIAKFFPADGGITAGVLLGASGAIGATQSAAKFIQGQARNAGVLGADQNRSSAQKHKEYVNHTRSLYQYMDAAAPATKANEAKVMRAQQLLKATGVNTSAVYAADYGDAGGKQGQVKLIVDAMKAGR